MNKKKKKCYSGIGGQAVLEGVMMKNEDHYAVAVRKPDGEIDVETQSYLGVLHGNSFKKLPFVRGVFNLIDSLRLGMRTLNYSASFYEDEDARETLTDKAMKKVFKEKAEKVFMGFTIALSVILAVAIFIVLPYFLTSLFEKFVRERTLLSLIEGLIRIGIFVLYVAGISVMNDIRRLYRYHGAEHKCINCIERGRPLTVKNVKKSSRQHRRCGTSFMLFVLLISCVVFFFITVSNPIYRVLIRIALIPVIAGIAYEIIRLAGKSNNVFVIILSAPGMLLQRLTTKEPDEEMILVGIASVEAVFDWKKFLVDHFDADMDELKKIQEEDKEKYSDKAYRGQESEEAAVDENQ